MDPVYLGEVDYSETPSFETGKPEEIPYLVGERMKEWDIETRSLKNSRLFEAALNSHYRKFPPSRSFIGKIGWKVNSRSEPNERSSAMTELISLATDDYLSLSMDDRDRYNGLKQQVIGDAKCKAIETCMSIVEQLCQTQEEQYGSSWLREKIPGAGMTALEYQSDILEDAWEDQVDWVLSKLKRKSHTWSIEPSNNGSVVLSDIINQAFGAGKAKITLDSESLETYVLLPFDTSKYIDRPYTILNTDIKNPVHSCLDSTTL
ncbi:uncharacterized protein I303_107120 [Kwoniella dejecticola CBS 10117]|uniref:Uncharacterized protein n=1 Tax=Kwoniella dejecticola CBS 10117 TaxID=1296121 RepID=A0A1A5ZYS8_9TREE|nr:uncharacterized protein I303_06522 [Kwoniella dejecticola CBS 10117]OBR82964.1 hypothetical protein I303_06522 [Kwoniella dejecticola CBS 10117]